MKVIRIIVRCTANEDHAKILKLDPALGIEYAETLAGLLDGTSPFYIHKPGGIEDAPEWDKPEHGRPVPVDRGQGNSGSPIGRCGICGEPFTCTVIPVGGDDAESEQQSS